MNARDGAVPRNVGDCESGRSTDHSGNLGLAVVVNGPNGQRKSYVVTQILGEQGTDGAVDDARGQDSLLRGLTLSLEITAGDLTGSVHSFFKVNRQGQEIDAVAGLCGCGSAAQNDGVAVTDHNGTVCKTCNLTRFEYQGTACQRVAEYLVALELHLGAGDGSGHCLPP